jgi:hypothetical protein
VSHLGSMFFDSFGSGTRRVIYAREVQCSFRPSPRVRLVHINEIKRTYTHLGSISFSISVVRQPFSYYPCYRPDSIPDANRVHKINNRINALSTHVRSQSHDFRPTAFSNDRTFRKYCVDTIYSTAISRPKIDS